MVSPVAVAHPIPLERLRVERNDNPLTLRGEGWYVVEATPEGYDIPRGWTYPAKIEAERAISLVADGNWFPKLAEIYQRTTAR